MPSTSSVIDALPPLGWFGVLLTLCGIAGYGFRLIRFAARLAKNTADFLDDWQGEPARPGVPARLGILERQSNTEAGTVAAVKQVTAVADQVTAVKAQLVEVALQLRTNGGLSLKDQTNRIEQRLEDHIKATGGTK